MKLAFIRCVAAGRNSLSLRPRPLVRVNNLSRTQVPGVFTVSSSHYSSRNHCHIRNPQVIKCGRHFSTGIMPETVCVEKTKKTGWLSLNDPNSYSNPDQIRVSHIHLNWTVDFSRKVIFGTATYELELLKKDAVVLVLDSSKLNIKKVTDGSGKEVEFRVLASHSTFGSAFMITLPPGFANGLDQKIIVEYETAPGTECTGLQWLEKEQTAMKEQPFLFSQCQAIHARSLMPCQDTPFTKCPYSAEVKANKEVVVLMSAVRGPVESDGDMMTFRFEQKVPIPSYLLAIVCGKLDSRKIGPRSHVWAEQKFVDEAAFDFSETETMIQTAEKLVGDYVWGVYDLLVLPPSFPYGGMENPCLTFVSPTLLTGDKSLANVIAHEISHSWTGNLVTNANWEHFWLNEGFTMFLERKISAAMFGEQYRQFESIDGWKTLKECIATLGPKNSLTKLVPDLTAVDPDDCYSSVPYENGYAFLYYLEETVGGKELFEPFLKHYIQNNSFKSIDSFAFKQQFIEYFTKAGKQTEIKSIDWDGWFFTVGMPLVHSKYDETLSKVCHDLKQRWLDWDSSKPCPFKKEDLLNMSASQIEQFLTEILDSGKPLDVNKVLAMQDCYQLNATRNAELRFRWLRIGLQAKWMDAVTPALEFVTEVGRMKYVRPIYRDLYDWEEVRQRAIDTFNKNRPFMMACSVQGVAKDLHLRE